MNSDLTPGKYIGILSYQKNDAKKSMLNGITTISPDFKAMGKATAEMVLTGHMQQVDNPYRVLARGLL
ncbi:hypothetical protein LZD49_12160 [Dyadobacter sp. CY261]|uniref:hypothetical protein n=1 Tax=Dyadobacter sp. CY261 TaxID=2907203 RepID=UPI001F449E24|nr:hypothetical protein [Dyadobacter sp. CY261]